MKSAKLQALQKQVNHYTRDRQKLLADIEAKRTRYTWGVSLFLTLFIFSTISTYGSFSTSGWALSANNIVALLWTLTGLFGAMMLYTQTLAPPNDKQEIDEWLWRRGRRFTVFTFLTFFIWAIGLTLPTDLYPYHNHNRNFVLISFLAFTMYPLAVLLVLWKPIWFISRWLSILGAGGFYFFAGTTPFRLIALVFDIKSIPGWLIGLFAIPLISRWSLLAFRQVNTHKLNLIQLTSISIVHPDRLLLALRTYDQALQDQYQALRLKFRIEKDLPLGIKTELIKLYGQEHEASGGVYWWLTVGLGIIGAIVGAISEAFIQDFIYDPMLKPLLCSIWTYFCS